MLSFVVYDRSNTRKRVIEIDPNGNMTITMERVLWCTITGDPTDIEAVDPDGGPYFHKGYQVGAWVMSEFHDYIETDDGKEEKTAIVNGKATSLFL